MWKQSKNWLFYSGFKVSKYLNGRHRHCLSHSICPRHISSPLYYNIFIFPLHTYIGRCTHKYTFIVVWLHTSDMINRIVCLSRSEIHQNIYKRASDTVKHLSLVYYMGSDWLKKKCILTKPLNMRSNIYQHITVI